YLLSKLFGLSGRLIERLRKAMSLLHVLGSQCTDKLYIVVAGHAVGATALHHPHYESKHFRGVRTAVDKVAEEYNLPTFGMVGDVFAIVPRDPISELLQQLRCLDVAAVDVADDVEGPCDVLLVVPQRLSRDRHVDQFFRRTENMHVPEPLAVQVAQRPVELAALVSNNVVAEVAVRTARIALPTYLFWHVENQCDWN